MVLNSFVFFLMFRLFASVLIAPYDGTVVYIVASLHLADGTVVSCFVLVVSLGFALKKIIISSTSLIIYSFVLCSHSLLFGYLVSTACLLYAGAFDLT